MQAPFFQNFHLWRAFSTMSPSKTLNFKNVKKELENHEIFLKNIPKIAGNPVQDIN